MRGGKAPPSPHLDAEAFHLRVTCRWDTPLVTTAHVRLLGPVGFVTADGRLVDLPSATQRRLLAILALAAGTTLRPDHLAEALGTSAGGLRTALSRVRARVGEEIIRTGAVGYHITCAVDSAVVTGLIAGASDQADRLAALEEALSYWHGDALDEFRPEPWAEAEATRLDELRAIAVEDRAETLIARSRCADAVVAMEAHVRSEPRRDRPRGLLIQALAGDGRQADALQAYQDYRAYLAEETGTEPSDAVRSIERQVAAGWTVAAGEPAAASRPHHGLPFEMPLHPVLATGPDLIGRRRELSWLESALAQTRSGSSTAVLLSGEPGIGKTTLLAFFARAHHGHSSTTVLYGRCTDGASVPLQPFRSLIGAVVDHAPMALLRQHTEHRGGDLQRIASNLSNRLWAPPPMSGDDATERFQLFEAVADLLRRLAGAGPLVVILDDLHWAEPTALLLLRHLRRALADVPVLLVLSWRDTGEEPTDHLRSALADLEGAGARRVELVGFDDVELSDLVTSITGTITGVAPHVVEDLRAQTAGNPLYAGHFVRHLLESGRVEGGEDGIRFSMDTDADAVVPPNLRDLLWNRVRSLGEGPADLLGIAAVLGTEFSEQLLVDVADDDERDVRSAVDSAVDAGLLDDDPAAPGTFRFSHALVAQALYAELGGSRRRRLHERTAMILEGIADPTAQAVVVTLARHWERARRFPEALHWATVAGEVALENLAPAEAAGWFQRSLAHARALGRPEAEQADLLVRLGVAQRRAGDPAAHDTVIEAGRLAARSGTADVLVRAALADEHMLVRVGEVDEEMLLLVERALAVADREDTATYASLLAIHALQLVPTPRAELRQRVAREAIELVERSADPLALPRMISALQFALWGPGALPLRRQLADRAAAAAAASDDRFLQFWTSRAAFNVAVESADAVASAAALGRMQALAAEVGEPTLQWVVGLTEVFALTMQARLSEADQLSEQMVELGTQMGEPDAFSLYAGQLFMSRSFAGRYEELMPLLEDMVAANPDVHPFRLVHAIGCCAVGRIDEAAEVLAAGAAAGFALAPADYFWMTTIIGYAVLAIELEAADMAAELYPILEPYAREVAFNGATSQGHIGAYLGKLASLLGRHDVADEHLRRALEVNCAFGWEYHEATTLVALALSQVRRTGALDSGAAAALDRAQAIAEERGLALVVAQVARLRGDAPL